MFPSISLVQEVGFAVLLVAALVWVIGLGHVLWGSRLHRPAGGEAEGLDPGLPDGRCDTDGLTAIPRQRGRASHPMERVQLTEAEEQAFAGLVRSLPRH
ncbi:hypothetical protein [Streptomyces bambusae]|uniref:Uncharacterized protein n=1 Tax=Streptomyces bambusae TaxID=1550616 RepID=A0ABS6Z7L1_9ACTN|nr:hypothetical protein [Streptomyces bambusae]MBW5483556.1 hypothetical protein [Streptomyces bambusae]